jgi:transposase
MARRSSNACSRCALLRRDHQELQARLEQLEKGQRDPQELIRELREESAELRKDSSTSAKPPPSGIVKPPKPAPDPDAPRRSLGGQPGHTPHFRDSFPPERLSATVVHRLTHCPGCGHPLEPTAGPPRIVQQIDLQPLTYAIEGRQSHPSWCPQCQRA